MNSRNDIQSELKLLNSSLPSAVKEPVFDLPQGYFENFAARVLAIIKGEAAAESTHDELLALSPLLAGLPRHMPFALPENYFQEHAPLPPATAPDEALPAWLEQSRTMPFAVPEGYFEHFGSGLLPQLKPQAKVVPLFSRNWVRYVAAAVLAGALVLGGILYTGTSNGPTLQSQPQAWVEKKLQNVSSAELDAFIETVDITGAETAQQTNKGRPEVRRLLQDVPVSELDAFLEQVPADGESLN